MVQFNGTKYAYIHNLQGDIVGLIDSTGTEVVKYAYDAWGKPLSTTGSLASTLGTVQPFRYRGYLYDVETGLYYLRSRYYNPAWGRFVSADRITSGNMYAYCKNNWVILYDPNGCSGMLTIFVRTDKQDPEYNAYIGHAWIVYKSDEGTTTSYGLWGNSYPNVGEDGLYINREAECKGKCYKGSTYCSFTFRITNEEEERLYSYIEEHKTWYRDFTCTDFTKGALEALLNLESEVLEADDYLDTEELKSWLYRLYKSSVDCGVSRFDYKSDASLVSYYAGQFSSIEYWGIHNDDIYNKRFRGN